MKIEVTEDKRRIYLSITHNGVQWSTLTLNNPEEVKQIRDELNTFLGQKKEKGE